MNKKEIEEFGMLKQKVNDIDETVKKIDRKLDCVIEQKLDKQDFEQYKNSQQNWKQWVIPLIISLASLAVMIISVVK